MSSVIHRKGHRESKVGEPRVESTDTASQDPIDDAFNPAFAFVRPPGPDGEEFEPAEPTSKVDFNGRNVEIPDHYRIYVGDKLARLERYDPSIFRFDVELNHEPNRRQSKVCQTVEITAVGKGPKARAVGTGENFYAALESSLDKLESRLRRVKDRRRVSYGNRRPISVAEATEIGAPQLKTNQVSVSPEAATPIEPQWDDGVDPHEPGKVVRIKEHESVPMSVDDALYEMELVGHDFFLFHDKESDKPSVVYRRHAFDYGLIRLA